MPMNAPFDHLETSPSATFVMLPVYVSAVGSPGSVTVTATDPHSKPVTGRTTTVPHHGNRTLLQGTLLGIFSEAGIPKPKR